MKAKRAFEPVVNLDVNKRHYKEWTDLISKIYELRIKHVQAVATLLGLLPVLHVIFPKGGLIHAIVYVPTFCFMLYRGMVAGELIKEFPCPRCQKPFNDGSFTAGLFLSGYKPCPYCGLKPFEQLPE